MTTLAEIQSINAQTIAGTESEFYGYVEVNFLSGVRPFVMFTNNDCSVVSKILHFGTYEAGSLALWCELAKTASSVIDAGAYTGIYSLAAAAVRPDVPVFAFEPNPYSAARLRVNRAANRFWAIDEHNVGLARFEGQAELRWRRKQRSGLSSNARFGAGGVDDIETASVQVKPLSSFNINVGDRPLIKIDVEGAELTVFRGLLPLLDHRPDIIVESFDPYSCAQITEILQPLGYKFFRIRESTGALDPQPALSAADPHSDMNQYASARRG